MKCSSTVAINHFSFVAVNLFWKHFGTSYGNRQSVDLLYFKFEALVMCFKYAHSVNPFSYDGYKKPIFISVHGKENLPPTETITAFSEEEVEKFKTEAFSVFDSSKRKNQQAVAYILMLDTRLRTGEAFVLLNSDIDIKFFTPKPLAELLDHTTSEITELYYFKRDLKMLNGITDGFEL